MDQLAGATKKTKILVMYNRDEENFPHSIYSILIYSIFYFNDFAINMEHSEEILLNFIVTFFAQLKLGMTIGINYFDYFHIYA